MNPEAEGNDAQPSFSKSSEVEINEERENDVDVREEESDEDSEDLEPTSVKDGSPEPHSSKAQSTSHGLYSTFDEMIGGNRYAYNSLLNDEEASPSKSPKLDESISNHLKGTLSFGLPTKPGGLSFPSKKARSKHSKALIMNHSSTKKKRKLRRLQDLMKKSRPPLKEIDDITHLEPDLQLAYGIVNELMSDSLKSVNSIFLETIELDKSINGDYLEVVSDPIWLPKIKERLLANEYKTLPEVVSQVRLMLENTYRYFGVTHSFSKRALRMEHALEQKIVQLPTEKGALCNLDTQDILEQDNLEGSRLKSCSLKINGENYFSYLMFNVRGCRAAREKERKLKKIELMQKAKQIRRAELTQWEENLMGGTLGGPIKHMWELVQINQYLYLTLKLLNIPAISQYELERILMVPESSMTLRILMTTLLLSKQQRVKMAEKPYMPYRTWARRLANKTYNWYKIYRREGKDALKVQEVLGIEPKFWAVCGDRNPFDEKLFHELTLYQRVWLVKSLCDSSFHTHKSVQEVIMEQDVVNLSHMRETVLGRDRFGYEYIHFPQFKETDVRIYKRVNWALPSSAYAHAWEQCQSRRKNASSNLSKSGGGSTKKSRSKGTSTPKKRVTEKLFSKSQIKSFRKLLERLKTGAVEFIRCKVCNKKFTSKSALKSHHASAHSKRTEKSASESTRTRPQRLRQLPKPRYSFQFGDSDPEDSDPSKPPSRRGYSSNRVKRKKGESSDDQGISSTSSEDEGFGENEEEADEPWWRKAFLAHSRLQNDQEDQQESRNTCEIPFNEVDQENSCPGMEESSEVNDCDKTTEIVEENKEGEGEGISGLIPNETNTGDVSENENKKDENENEKMEEESIETSTTVNLREMMEQSENTSELEDKENEVEDKNGLEADEDSKTGSQPKSIPSDSLKQEIKSVQNESIDSDSKPLQDESKPLVSKQDGEESESLTKPDQEDSSEQKEPAESLFKPDQNESTDLALKSEKIEAPSRSQTPSDDESSLPVPDNDRGFHRSCVNSPDRNQFELVADSFAELRNLICKFGPIPSKIAKEKKDVAPEDEKASDKGSDEEMEETKDDEQENDDVKDVSTGGDTGSDAKPTSSEKRLHRALCELLVEWAPSETKMNAAQKQLKKKMWNEFLEWSKREETYVDSADEAWNSDPEPEPIPTPATQTPKPSSSSSSDEDSYNHDGTRKRKLRKRKAKRILIDSTSPTPEDEEYFPEGSTAEKVAVSSRGRVRKIKNIVNYDRFDFDKLAKEADQETSANREKKKKRREEDVQAEMQKLQELREAARKNRISVSLTRHDESNGVAELEKAANSLHMPSSGVKRYIISKEGEVVGYIDNDGKVHRGSMNKHKVFVPNTPEVKKPKPVKEKPKAPTIIQSDTTPKVVLSAYNDKGSPVYIRMVGGQALELMKIISNAKKGPSRQIKLQRFSQTYTFNTSSNVLTQNVPGFPDSDISNPLFNTTTPRTPQTTSNSQTSTTTRAPSTETAAAVAQPIKQPPNLSCTSMSAPSPVFQDVNSPVSTSCATLSAATNLVYATQSTVPSVPPLKQSEVPPSTSATSQPVTPLVIQTDNGQHFQVGVNNKLSQIVQKSGQRVVAVPNEKGGYTISLITPNNPGPSGNIVKVLPSSPAEKSGSTLVLKPAAPQVNPGVPINVVRTQRMAVPSATCQQVVSTYTSDSQAMVNNATSAVPRQVFIPQAVAGTSTGPALANIAQPVQVHLGHASAIPASQPQQQVMPMAKPGFQYVNPGNPRQVVHMVQPGQIFMSGNPVSVVRQQGVTQPKVVQVPQGHQIVQQSQLFQQQVQQPVQIQYQNNQVQPSVSIQSRPQLQMVPQQVHPAVTVVPGKPQAILQTHNHSIQTHNHSIQSHTSSNVLQGNVLTNQVGVVPNSLQASNTVNETPVPAVEQKPQMGRLLLVQTDEGQKVCVQHPDGKVSVLSPEQLKPLIASGAIKVNNT